MITNRTPLTALALIALAAPAARAQGTTPDSTHHAGDTTYKAPAAAKPASPSAFSFAAWVFGNYQVETDAAAKAANGGSAPNKFDINRAYLTFGGPIGDRVGFRVTTDIKQGGATADYKGWFVRLKYAYLQYNYLDPSAAGASGFARIGVLHTVIIDHEENFWPRYLVQTAVERDGFMVSADLGAAGQLSLPHQWGELYGTIVNGQGYENPENNKYKDYQLRLSLTPFTRTASIFSTFDISPWISHGGNASAFLNDPANPITQRLAKNRWGLFVGNRDRRLTFGADYAERTDDADGTTSAATDVITSTTGQLYDGFVIIRPFEFAHPQEKQSVGAVFRLDHFKPNKDLDGYQQFVLAGLFWEPTRKAAFALDYQKSTPKRGLTGTVSETWFLHWNLVL